MALFVSRTVYLVALLSLLGRACDASSGVSAAGGSILTDTQALLDFKALLLGDPLNQLSTWDPFVVPHTCKWRGVNCSNERVVELTLASSGLQGTISPSLGKLDQLTSLDLSNNSLSGLIPAELGSLARLTTLSLFSLFFSDGATIPASFGGLQSLLTFTMSGSNVQGAIPAKLGKLTRLTHLDLNYNSLNGSIPASLINLPSLRYLDLSLQQPPGLTGPIPPLPAHAPSNLTHLDLNSNSLTGSLVPAITTRVTLTTLNLEINLLTGGIPAELSSLTALTELALGANPLGGLIPPSLGTLGNLCTVGFSRNNLTGTLPPQLAAMGNSSCALGVSLLMPQNSLTGTLPDAYGLNINLLFADFGNNLLTGGIPDTWILNTVLSQLSVGFNNMSGLLPATLSPSFQVLNVSGNRFSGPIPPGLFTGGVLYKLSLDGNQLSGPVPEAMNNCPGLISVDLQNNHLSGPLPALDALNALRYFKASGNAFNSSLPPNLFNWSQAASADPNGDYYFTTIDLSDNRLEGPIPAGIKDMLFPASINISNNRFTGDIDMLLSPSSSVVILDLSHNRLTANLALLPPPLQPLLYTLLLQGNQLHGNIPGNFTSYLPRLRVLDLSDNRLHGSVPRQLGTNSRLTSLSLGGNSLSGPLPPSLQTLPRLHTLNCSHNQLGDILPDNFANYSLLQTLDLSSNHFSGPLPPSLVELTNLTTLDLSSSSFNGSLPPGMAGLAALQSANFSFNSLSGPIPGGNLTLHTSPASFSNNSALCGNPLAACPTSSQLSGGIIAAIVAGGCLALLLLLSLTVFLFYRQRKFGPDNGKLVLYHQLPCVVTYSDILKGSNQWGEDTCLGKGGFGSVYRVVLRDGVTVAAVKRLHADSQQGQREVEAEIKSLGRLKHKNLAVLWGSYSSETECLLIYELIAGGDVDGMLKRGGEGWGRRHKILRGSAAAISYLHHDTAVVVIHRDIKPANILIGKEGEAFLADFGLAREKEHSDESAHVSTRVAAGTVGYMAPEYAIQRRMSTKSDVYAFGVVILEVVTGKRPTDKNIGDAGLSKWVGQFLAKNEGLQVVDASMKYDEGEVIELLGALKVGLMCTSRNATDRPTMREVVTLLGHLHMFGTTSMARRQDREAPPDYEVVSSAELSFV